MSMIPASRPLGITSITSPSTSEPPRSAAWHAAWEHLDAMERLIRDDSTGADRAAMMACVLRMRQVLVRAGAVR